MSAAELTPEVAPDPAQDITPQAPAPFTMLGASGVGVCEGDVCAMPGAVTGPQDTEPAN